MPARFFSTLNATAIALFCYAAVAAQSAAAPIAQNCQEEMVGVKERLGRLETYLKDWPKLGHYREANAGVARPQKNELRVVFMGDSITDFWDNPGYGGFFPTKPYINRGISGQITPQMLIRFRQDVIALQPKVVVILAGTNDIAGNIGPTTFSDVENNLATMSELAKAHRIRVVLASLLPVSDYNRTRDGKTLIRTTQRPLDRIQTVNSWIKRYAADNGHIFLDYFTAMADEKWMLKEDLSNDGVHPNAKGYSVMAPLVEAAISTALKKGK